MLSKIKLKRKFIVQKKLIRFWQIYKNLTNFDKFIIQAMLIGKYFCVDVLNE